MDSEFQPGKKKARKVDELTLFVPSLHGQSKVVANEIIPLSKVVSRVIQMGNLLGCNKPAKDIEFLPYGNNLDCGRMMYGAHLDNPKFEFLIGANEMMCLNAPNEWTRPETSSILRAMWLADNARMKVATVSQGRLVTHAGLTHRLWEKIGRPDSALQAAVRLNKMYEKVLYPGECFFLGDAPSFSANPIFAHPFAELIPSWVVADEPCPFDQVCGAYSINNEQGRKVLHDNLSMVHYVDDAKLNSFGSEVFIKGASIKMLDLNLPIEQVSRIPPPNQLLIERYSRY